MSGTVDIMELLFMNQNGFFVDSLDSWERKRQKSN